VDLGLTQAVAPELLDEGGGVHGEVAPVSPA